MKRATMRDDEDAALVRAARDGDKDAFVTLLNRHRALLVALCHRMLDDPSLVEDAAQEATLQALLGLDALRRPDRFGPWLGGIGLNVCRRLTRERASGAWSLDALYGGRRHDGPVDWALGPAELAAQAEIGRRVRLAVSTLPRGQRAAVVLFYLSDLSHVETAAHLGIGAGAVKTRLHKARENLKESLRDDWEEQHMTTGMGTTRIEVSVHSVRKNSSANTNAVILKEIDGPRYLPIWIGEDASYALAHSLRKSGLPRPLTHTLMGHLLDALDGRVREARVTRLDGEVYYAELIIAGPARTATLDARPSDAIALALMSGAPILVETAVLDATGVTPDQDPTIARRAAADELFVSVETTAAPPAD